MNALSDGVKSILGFLTSTFDGGHKNDIFEEMGEDMYEVDYPTDNNAALEPVFKMDNRGRGERNLKVVPMASKGGYEVVVFEPRAFNESTQIVEALKERKTVILNLQLLDRDQSQRIVDFICGCAHALDGNQRKIGDFVFIFTPSNISLSQEMVSSKMNRDALWSTPLS